MSERMNGKIRFISAYRGGGRLMLEGYDKEFILDKTLSNYNALFSLAMAAAVNRSEVRVSYGDLTAENVHYANGISIFW